MKISTIPLSITALLLFSASCQNTTSEGEGETDSASRAQTVQIAPVKNAATFPGASLALNNPTTEQKGDSVVVRFSFDVKNYELTSQTTDENSELCSNSDKGQHIHFILDNRPYKALYEPKHEETLAKNSEHYVLAFLSRSYHLSLKDPGVALLYHFRVDENGQLQKLENDDHPMVFYSRPKGDYLGEDAQNVLLDFYVWNTTLGNANQVRVDITGNGADTTFTVRDWQPYFLQNLPMGKATITLSMLDNNGNKLDGENTEVTREITLAQNEPLPR